MKLTNLTIRDLINPEATLTFLVGAGCSLDPPSCLPAGKPMMEAIIKYTCDDSEIKRILNLEELRFETLVEIIRDRLDPELKLIDFYGQCDKPNLHHFFLSEMIQKGHFVMTTNFDFLIEHALLQSNVPREEIKIIITKADFEYYNNPDDLFKQGKKTLYKIHGSTQNIIKGEKTRDTLIATIQAFGSNKEGLNVFQVEPFKQKLFHNITDKRSLVIMGYSGSDDFDIVPTLKVLKNIKDVIWINFIKDDGYQEKIYEIEDNEVDIRNDKVNQILSEIQRMKYASHVYRVDTNTSRLINELIKDKSKLSNENFSLSPTDWLKTQIKIPNEIIKYTIPALIYMEFDMYEDALRCQNIVLQIAEEIGDKTWKAPTLNNIAMIYQNQRNLPEALKWFEEALNLTEEIGNLAGKGTILDHIGSIFKMRGDVEGALKKFEESLKIAEEFGNLNSQAICLNNIGDLYEILGYFPEALDHFRKALEITENLGDLHKKSTLLNNMGKIYYSLQDYKKALEFYEEALKICEQLGNLSVKASILNGLGLIYDAQGKYNEAFSLYTEALKLNEKLRNLSDMATTYSNIGEIYRATGKYEDALKMYFKALKIDDQLENLSGTATEFNNIATVYLTQGNVFEALKYLEKTIDIAEKLKNLNILGPSLNSIGMIHFQLKNYPLALNYLEKTLQILSIQGLGDSSMANMVKSNIESIKTYL